MARATLKEIARQAGVSVSTVSLALSGKGKISPHQVERIKAIADQLGYTPSPLLASLASKRFRTGEASLGNMVAVLLFPYTRSATQRNSVYRQDLTQAAYDLGYNPQVFDYDSIRAYTDLPGTLYRRGTLGVIVSGQPDPELFADRARWRHFSLVQCGRYRSPLQLDTVRPVDLSAIKLACQRLIACGYERIGFGMGLHDPVLEDDEARHGAALVMQRLHFKARQRLPIYSGGIDDKAAFLNWVKETRPDVVLGFSIGQWWWLHDAGYRIPEDIGYASLHTHIRDFQVPDPQIAGLVQRQDQIARQSVVLVDQLIRHNIRGFPDIPHQVLITSEWHAGTSVRERLPVTA